MTITFPRVSIIVNSFKDASKLKSCLSAIGKIQYPDKEVIVTSYGISETSIKSYCNTSCIDKLISLNKDLGVSAQRNIGFKARDLKSKYVLFIDDDVTVAENAVKEMVKVLEKESAIGIAQPLLLTSLGVVDCAGAFIDPLGYTHMPFRGRSASLLKWGEKFFPVSYVAGACLILRVDLFKNEERFQPFDEQLYFNYEDTDISLRCWIKGSEVVCITSAIAFHKRGRTASLKKSPEKLVYLNTRNKFIVLTSVSNLRALLLNIPLFVIFENAKAILLIKVNPFHAFSTFKAITWGICNFKIIWDRRNRIMAKAIRKNIMQTINCRFNIKRILQGFSFHYDLSS